MYAITVHQPWAWAIIRGGKDVENRTRIGTWRRLVGERVAIHAGLKWSSRGAQSDLVIDAVARDHDLSDQQVLRPLPAYLFSPGVLLGVVTVDDVHEEQGGCCAPWGEQSYVGSDGRRRVAVVHLRLSDPQPVVTMLPCRGQLGPWQLPADLADEVRGLLR